MLFRSSEELQEDVINAYFGENGLNYNLCRTHISSCDFALGNYDYLDEETDKDLTGFSIERDEKYILPMIDKAMAKSQEEIVFLASPWSPPPFMKSNGEKNNGGYLKEEYYQMWADYFVKYIKTYEARGIKISMVTVQNEPEAVQTWDSCIYTGEQEMAFVRDYLGPTFEKAGYGHVKIIIWDHNKEIIFERANAVLSDKTASKYVAGVGFHWYSGDHFDAVSLVNETYPDKELYFTEGCVEFSRFADSTEVNQGEMYLHDMMGNFLGGMNGYFDWNMLLDCVGGPNHVKNYCAAPIMCTEEFEGIHKRLSYYYIGQLSKFVKRGAKRVATSRYTDAIKCVGFVNPDGEKVLVLLNKSDKDVEVSLKEYKNGTNFVVESHSAVTVCYF